MPQKERATMYRVTFLLLICACCRAEEPNILNSINSMLDTSQLTSLSNSMGTVMNSIGGHLENPDMPDFNKGLKDVMSFVNGASASDMQFDQLNGIGGNFSMNMEQHVQSAISAAGPMGCMVGGFNSDPGIMGLLMGGLSGAMFGEAIGENVSTSSYDMKDPFAELGALSGVMGAAAGGFVPGGNFDPDKFKNMMPGSRMMENMWEESQNQRASMKGRISEQFSMEKLESLITQSSGAFDNLLKDFRRFSTLINQDLEASDRKRKIQDRKITRISGVNSKLQKTVTGLISAASLFSGAIGDAVARSSGEKSLLGSGDVMKEKLKFVFDKLAIILKSWKEEGQKERGGVGRMPLSPYSFKRLKKLGVTLPFSIGRIGGHTKSLFDSKVITSTMTSNPFKPDVRGRSFDIKSSQIKKKAKTLTTEKKGRMSYSRMLRSKTIQGDMESCMNGIMPIMAEIERLSKMMMPQMDILDWQPPFSTKVNESWSKLGLPKYVTGDAFNDDWDFESQGIKVDLPQGLKESDFVQSFVPNLLQDPVIVDYINYANRMGKTKVIDFLKGSVRNADLPPETLRELPIQVLEYLQDKDGFSEDNMLDVWQNGISGSDYAKFAMFIEGLSHSYIQPLMSKASEKYWAGIFTMDAKMASIINKDISRRTYKTEFQQLIPDISTAGDLVTWMCPVGIFDYVLDEFKDSILDYANETSACIKSSIGRFAQNKHLLMRLKGILNDLYSDGISLSDALKTKYLINFLPSTAFDKFTPDDALNISKMSAEYFMPVLPGFKVITEALAFVSTAYYREINNTDILAKLGPVACGLRRQTRYEKSVNFSDEAIIAVKEACAPAMRKIKKEKAEMVKKCMENRRCKIPDKSPKGFGYRGRKRDKSDLINLRDDFQNILSKSTSEMIQEFDKFKDINDLSKEQMKAAAEKILADGIDFQSTLLSMGDLTSELPTEFFTNLSSVNLTEFVINRPTVVQRMKNINKIVITEKLSSNFAGFLEKAGQLKSLTSTIPSYKLIGININTNQSFKDTISSVNWKRSQAFQLADSSRSVTYNDIRKMGKLAISLTCHDVRRMRMGSIIKIANALEDQIGDSISPDLAECVGLKIFLHLQSKYKNDKYRIVEVMSKEVPPIFGLYFPSESLWQLWNCKDFYKRVTYQLDHLMPHAAGKIILEDLASAAFQCVSMQHYGPPPGFDEMGFGEDMGNFLPGAETIPHNARNMPYANYSGKPEVYDHEKDLFMQDLMAHIPKNDYGSIGRLLCMIKPGQIKYMGNPEFLDLLKEMHSCINDIQEETLSEIHEKIERDVGSSASWDEEILYKLGPFVSTFPMSTLDNIQKEYFRSEYEYMIPLPERKSAAEDKTSDVLDIASLFQFNPDSMGGEGGSEGPPRFNTSWTPFRRQEFFQAAVKAVLGEATPTLDDLTLLGPGALPYILMNSVSADLLMSALSLYGRISGKLSTDTETAIKEKISSYTSSNGISKYSDDMLQKIGGLASIFTASEINAKFEITKLETLAVLGQADWRDSTQVSAVLDIYLGGRQIGDITGPELVAIGNMHCLLDVFKVDDFSTTSLKFALREIGKLRCFTQDKIDLYKGKVDKAFGGIHGGVLQEMGILAAGFSADELVSFGKPNSSGKTSPLDRDVNLIPHEALKVIPASRIVSGFDDSQYARLGTVNAGTLLQRQDIFISLSNRTKNALFAAAFGLNAGVYAGYIHYSRNFDEDGMKHMEQMMDEMMKKLQMAMTMGVGMPTKSPFRKPKPEKTKASQAFGLKDVLQAKRPEPPPLASGLSKKDLQTFDKKLLNDRLVVEMINSAAKDDLKILEVMKGDSSLNDIPDEDIVNVPLKLLQGLKKDTIQEMSSEKLALILDSDEVSKDTKSLSRTLNKLDMDQFKKALEIMTDKMNKSDGTWRPPIGTQEAVSAKFFRFNFDGPEDALKSFLDCMCPFAAGIPPRRIMDIPQDVNYIGPVIDCFDISFKDLDQAHRRQIINWINTMWKKVDLTADKAIIMKNFLLDLPLKRLQQAFTISDINTFVSSGAFLRLDKTHKKYSKVAKYIVKSTTKLDISKFSDDTFMKNLGNAKCEIRLQRVRKAMDLSSLKSLFEYTLKHCKNHEQEVQESLKECTGDAALRLKRCALLEKEIRKENKEKLRQSIDLLAVKPKKAQLKRMNIKDLEMMKDAVDVYLGDKDLTTLKASDVREVAGALGALKPRDIDKIPEQAILDNIDVLKNNTKLTKRQKRKIFKKIQSAGFQLTDSKSLTDLGELVTSVPPKEFKKLTVDGLKESLSELKKHSASLSFAQKRAIVDKLSTGDVSDIMNADLGDLVTEIPLSDLENLDTVEMDKIKDKPWRRGQAANLVRKFREANGLTGSLTVDDIRTMGKASVGVTCMDVMKMLDDEVYDGAQALNEETEGTLTLDMKECVSTKLHYALQVMNGIDYIANSTDPELSSTLSFIPEDVAMMMSTKELERIPSTSCMSIMENIGNAQLDMLPAGTGDLKREELANISISCVQENSFDPLSLEESEVLTLGQLTCDMNIEEWKQFSEDGFEQAIPILRDCFHRLDDSQLTYIESFVIGKYGADSSQWSEDSLISLGPLVSTLDKSMIDNIDKEMFYEFLDDIMPPELSEDMPAYERIHYDDFYNKSVDVVMSQRSNSLRRKREVVAPTYDEIVVLGPGNIAWSVDELTVIPEEDFINSIETLGSVSKWSSEQMDVLVARMKEVYGQPSEWESKEIADAQYLIKGLTFNEMTQLGISEIETCTSLSQVDFTNDERSQLIDSYLRANGLALRILSSSELVGFGALVCGLSSEQLIEIPVESMKASTKDLGKLDCFSQTQYDIIKQLSLIGHGTTVPSAPELDEMGTIAAGLSSGDLSVLPVESIAFINPAAFLLMTPTRIKAGLNETQILAAGARNIAVLMTPRIFDQLYAEQRNALRLAVYGEDAELEDIPIYDDIEQEEELSDIEIFGDDSAEDEVIVVQSTTETTKADASVLTSNRYLLLVYIIIIAFFV